MAHYDTPEQVGKFLSDFTLTVTGEKKGTFSPDHTRYFVTLSRHGKDFDTAYESNMYTAYESNPSVHGAPTVSQVFFALANDALAAGNYDLRAFLDEYRFSNVKPSEVYDAYQGCTAAREFLCDTLYLSRADLEEMAETLELFEDEISEIVEEEQTRTREKEAHDHPQAPKGYVTVKELMDDLDIGEVAEGNLESYDLTGDITDAFGDIADGHVDIYYSNLAKWLPGNEGWIEDAEAEGLLEGVKGDIYKMIQMGQYECFRQDLYDHREDICQWATLSQLSDAGVYAVSADVAKEIAFLDFTDDYAPVDEAKEAIYGAAYDSFTKGYGEEFAEYANDLMQGDDDPVGFVNPGAMSIETVRAVNEKGYDAVFSEFWKAQTAKDEVDFPDPDIPSLSSETRDMSAAKDVLASTAPSLGAMEKDGQDTHSSGSGADDNR